MDTIPISTEAYILLAICLSAVGMLGIFLWTELRAMKNMGSGRSPNAAKYAIPWKAVMYAPLTHIPLTILATYDRYRGLSSIADGLLVAFVFITPMFYLGMLFWGIPAYLLLVRLNALNIATICLAGSAIPAVLLRNEAWYTTLIGVGACVTVSATAYLLHARNLRRA